MIMIVLDEIGNTIDSCYSGPVWSKVYSVAKEGARNEHYGYNLQMTMGQSIWKTSMR